MLLRFYLMTSLETIVGLGVLAVVLATGCGGADSTLPPEIVNTMKATKTAFNQGDAEAACQSLGEVSNAIYKWQEFAKGNQPVLIEELLHRLEGVSFDCANVRSGGEVEIASLQSQYGEWDAFVIKNTTRKSGFAMWLVYILGPLLVGGFLMYWRRKFREA